MGRVKEDWIEATERGWSAPDTAVCPDCVKDPYLKQLLASSAIHNTCDYCGRTAESPIAADTEVLVEAVWKTVGTYYCDPTDGVPYDHGFIVDPIDFPEVLFDLGFSGHARLMEDMEGTDTNCAGFVEAVNGDWAGSHADQVAMTAWSLFSHDVKHRTRFHFNQPDAKDIYIGPYEVPVSETLSVLANYLRAVERTLPRATVVYRVRQRKRGDTWEPVEGEMGAPPDDRVRAGRMNPAGIAYLYTAFDPETAAKEVGATRRGGGIPFLARFELTQDVVVFDLTAFPPEPSIFDIDNKPHREARKFIESFSRSISAPVSKDGSEHIDYVPSQVVCEYLAQAFELRPGTILGGLIYASAVRQGGKNLVLFPSHPLFGRDFQGASFADVAPYV
jgi:hypothetical protein